ncbi:transposase [Streptomyces sp. NPDC048641]|uniref:transposase n=1 Tax=Streptomyces sp. NPDC048641 TaxID=3154825 RepID=UPI0034461BB1
MTDQEWDLLARLVPSAVTGRPRVDDRRVINGMVYKIRTGMPWRDLPDRNGPWQTVYTRFRRYALSGVFTPHPLGSALGHRRRLLRGGVNVRRAGGASGARPLRSAGSRRAVLR